MVCNIWWAGCSSAIVSKPGWNKITISHNKTEHLSAWEVLILLCKKHADGGHSLFAILIINIALDSQLWTYVEETCECITFLVLRSVYLRMHLLHKQKELVLLAHLNHLVSSHRSEVYLSHRMKEIFLLLPFSI